VTTGGCSFLGFEHPATEHKYRERTPVPVTQVGMFQSIACDFRTGTVLSSTVRTREGRLPTGGSRKESNRWDRASSVGPGF
jgi:hypothetical protein